MSVFGIAARAMETAVNNTMAQNREEVARRENFEYNERSANAADARTRKLYNDLQSPKAIKEQLEEAGLSPSLMYGGGMQGSVAQGAQGNGGTGISPNVFGMSALEGAQIGLINAQTNKTNKEAENISTDTDKKKAEIDNIVEQTKNEQLKQVYNELNNTLAQMDVNLKGTYAEPQMQADIAKAQAQARQLNAQIDYLVAQGKVAKESADAIITYNRNKVIEQAAEIFLKQQQAALTKANITLTSQQVEKLINDIQVSNEIVSVAKRKVTVDENKLKEQVAQWAKENDLRSKEIDVQLTKTMLDFYNGVGANVARTIDALIPL